MNKRPDKPAGEIVPFDAPELPAVKKPPNKFRLCRILADHADMLIECSNEFDELRQKLRKREPGDPLPDVREAQLGDYEQRLLKRAKELLALLDPKDAYEEEIDDGLDEVDEEERRLKRNYVKKRLALMLAAIPAGKAGTPDGYVTMLLEHVADQAVCALALETACRELEQTLKFLPSIAEVMPALREHTQLWWKRRRTLSTVEHTANELQARIKQLRRQVECEAAQRLCDQAAHRLNACWATLERLTKEIAERQEKARIAHQEVEAAMARLPKASDDITEAAGALARAKMVLDEQEAINRVEEDSHD